MTSNAMPPLKFKGESSNLQLIDPENYKTIEDQALRNLVTMTDRHGFHDLVNRLGLQEAVNRYVSSH